MRARLLVSIFSVTVAWLVACGEGDPQREYLPDGVLPVDGIVPTADGSVESSDSLVVQDGAPKPDAPPPPPSFSFVVFGDNQFATNSCTSGIPERMAVPKAILKLSPDLVLHTGDLMDHGYDAGAYAKFVSCYKGMLAKLPLFPTMGNHDAGYTGIKNYKAYLKDQLFSRNPDVFGKGYGKAFAVTYGDDKTAYSQSFDSPSHLDDVPSGVSFKTFYALKHKNAYFISFEQGTRWWSNTPKSWVEKHLKLARSDPAIQHVFVTMHHPLYSSTMAESSASGECIAPVRKHYQPLFRKYDVTIVFSGHAHLYDRFYVPDDGAATRKDPPPKSYPAGAQAVHYIVTGGGGGPLNKCTVMQKEKSYGYFQKRICTYHVTRVQVSGAKLTVSAITVKGSASSYTTSVKDSFTIK